MSTTKFFWNRLTAASIVLCMAAPASNAASSNGVTRRAIGELKPLATIHLGKTADWVAVTPDSVWVGGTGPYAVHKIDPKTNTRVLSVNLQGEPCSGLALGFGSLWIPLCGRVPTLAKVDLNSGELTSVFKIGPAGAEGGIATSPDSVWLVTDKKWLTDYHGGTISRLDLSEALAHCGAR